MIVLLSERLYHVPTCKTFFIEAMFKLYPLNDSHLIFSLTLFWLGYFDPPILVGGGKNCPPPLKPSKMVQWQ